MKYTHFLSALAVTALAAPAFCQGTWNFATATSNGHWASPHPFYDGPGNTGVSITASGWDVTNSEVDNAPSWSPGTVTQHDLYGKYTSGNPGETGLGLTNSGGDTDFEIAKNQYVQFDLTNAINAYGKHFNIGFGSLQANEGYSLFESVTASSPFTLLSAGGVGSTTTSIPVDLGNYKFIEVSAYGTASEPDTLVMDAFHRTPASTPEPFTIALGLAGMGVAVRRRMKAKA